VSDQAGKLNWFQAVLMAIGGLTLLILPIQCQPKKQLVIDGDGALIVVKKTWFIFWGNTEIMGEVRQSAPGHYLYKEEGTSAWTIWNWESFQQMSE
jgi:hypothetical protein